MIAAIIQARLGSTRLPNKVAKYMPNEKTMLECVVDAAEESCVDEVIIATPNPPIAMFMGLLKKKCFLGSEKDVLGRYYECAKTFKVDDIVRLTADCPLMRPGVIDLVVKEYFDSGADYCYNRCDDSGDWPDGLDVEVFSFEALEKAHKTSEKREHVTDLFRCGDFKTHIVSPVDFGECVSVDTIEDYNLACLLWEKYYGSSCER
jgi:spore coat polysaccharide biosynthesis protein SpsF (cytidylyltransferase family)